MDNSIPGGNIPVGSGNGGGTFGNGSAPLGVNTSLGGDGYPSGVANSAGIPPAESPASGGEPTVEKVS